MKLQNLTKQLVSVGRRLTAVVLGFLAIAIVWHGGTSAAAVASPAPQWLIAADIDDQVQNKVGRDAQRAKGFIQDAAEEVKETARNNASRVDDATDGNNFLERKAQRDAGRIQERANQDASRTQNAVESTKNFVQDTVENIKDAID